MVCIYCSSPTQVTNSREKARTPSVWRRRRCIKCVAQFTTTELPDYATALVVQGQDSSSKFYPFSRDKLFLSIHSSLGHRKDALGSSTELTRTVIGKLLSKKHAVDGVISVQSLSKVTYETLKRFDPLGANTYKAYHQAALKGQKLVISVQ